MFNAQYNLTHPQKRIWYSEKLHPGTGMWNNAGTLKIKGKVDYSLLEKAFCLFVRQNDAVRMRIGDEDGVPYQYVKRYEPFSADFFDFSERGIEKLYEWDSIQTQTPMPLIDSDLFYFALFRLSDEEGGFYLKFHHIISDGISFVEFTNQIIESYTCLLSGADPEPKKRSSYIDYIQEEQDYLKSERFLIDKKFWSDLFENLPEPTVIKQRKTHYLSKKAKRKTFVVSESISAQIRNFCSSNKLSVFSVFLSALSIYVNRITNKKDIIIGTPVANRTSRKTRNAIGMFVSTVPVRIKVKDDLTFSEFARSISRDWFSILKHQKYPYDLMLQDLRESHKDLSSLYDVTLSCQIGTFNKDQSDFSYAGRWHFSGYQADSLNIHINDREDEGRFIVDYDYHTPLFYGKEIEYIHQHLINIICDMMNHSGKKLYELTLMSEEEKKRILTGFNNNSCLFPENKSLVDIWNMRIKNALPDDIAVINQGQYMTYKEIDELSSKLALKLNKNGVCSGSIVGLLAERNFDYCIYILAILKAGGAFMPIDSGLPQDRITYMIQDSRAKFLLASPHLLGKCPQISDINVIEGIYSDISTEEHNHFEFSESSENSNGLAYIIYTSGSTGQPKGVQIEQKSIVQLVYSLNKICNLPTKSRVLCAASISFDLSIMELIISLFAGNTAVLAPDHEANIPKNLVSLIKTTKVNAMIVTPGRMELLLSDSQGAQCLANFDMIGLGGDVLSEKLLAKVQNFSKAQIFNFYGPTEITICCTCADVTHAKVPNIGKPMHNVNAYILDSHLNPVPIGIPGELFIGGVGVSKGYIGKPELNKERFLDNPFIPGGKIYRTGDLARWYPLGEIEFLGRIDNQVKIRGYRIELGEIENRLAQIEGITTCIVIDREDAVGRKFLCAYICGNPPTKTQIRAQLVKDLPIYMIPSYFINISTLPFNASGKVDRNLLPDPINNDNYHKEDFVPAQTITEKELASIWSNVLGLEDIGRNDSFFEIGGDSLSVVKVMAKVQQKFQVDLLLEDIYRSPGLKEFAALIDTAEQKEYKPILPAPLSDSYPVSSAQKRMWIMSVRQNSQTAYNMPIVLQLSEKPDYNRLKRAFELLVDRHDSLRTSFSLINDELRQVIQDKASFVIERIECNSRQLKSKIKEFIRPFDLEKAPLLRSAQIETADDQYFLLIDMHHIISDRQTTEILMADLADFYGGKDLYPKRLEYKDFVFWHQSFMQSPSMKLRKDFWKNSLSGELPLLNLRTDRSRSAVQRFDGSRLSFNIDGQKTDKLRAFAAKHDGTLFMSMLAVYCVLLSKYTGQEDIIVGTPVSGRQREEIQQIAGVFINMIPLRNYPRGEMRFVDFFEELSQNTISALANSDYPFENIISDLNIQRDAARNPLFDTMLVQTKGDLKLTLGEIKARHFPFDHGVSKLDLTLEVYESIAGEGCHFEFEYNKNLFKKSTIERMAKHFCRLVEILAEEPDIRICDVTMLSQQELWQVTQGFNQTNLPLEDKSIQSLLEEQAEKQGEKTALIVNEKKYTFSQLNQRANIIAETLRKQGVGRNRIVALAMKRSFDLMAAIFGVLKAGGGYLPLDITYPQDRITFMLADCDAQILLVDESFQIDFNGIKINVNEITEQKNCGNPERIDKGEDVAYVVYTSGSTGLPKGCMIPRVALYNLYESSKTTIDYDSEQTSVSVTSVSFDIFIIDALFPLLFGCKLILCDEEELRQPRLLADLIDRHDIKFIQTTPTRMRIFMDDKNFRKSAGKHIQKIVLGGEEFPLSLLKILKKYTKAKIISGYGPSETTVYCTFKDLSNTSHITIGQPIANTRMYILDKYKRPVSIGVLGEAFISGACVATGYINRDDLNSNKFTPDPFWPGHVMYQSGDICAFMENGEMEIRGRVDHQVKIRGLRIELGEIEAALRSISGVDEAVIKVWGEGTKKYLCAYYQCNKKIDQDSIRNHLRTKLPAHMIPSFLVEMEELPTTLNGKINRKNLIEPQNQTTIIKKEETAMNKTEARMAAIWSKILKVDQVDSEDSFFALGGDSLGVIKIQAAIAQYGWTIRTQDFYDYQTLSGICNCINKQNNSKIKKSKTTKIVSVPKVNHLDSIKLKNIFITGATGYLGAHLLESLVDIPGVKIFCLVRGESNETCVKKLRKILNFYFGIEVSSHIFGRISVIKGDIGSKNMGIEDDILDRLQDIDTVIHSAALTDHIGHSADFRRANIDGTRNIVDFTQKKHASLLYISTVSVSGTSFVNDPCKTGVFTEECFYIGQNYEDNEYVKSKFLAEEIVLESIQKGLNARIFRVGVLTGALNGGFQMRPDKNAFANRLKSICKIGCVPKSMLSSMLEMTPVDSCVQAILNLTNQNSSQIAYHVFNTNMLSLEEIVTMLRQNGYTINIVSDEAFQQTIEKTSSQGDYDILAGFTEDLSSYSSNENISLAADMTTRLLAGSGFHWPVIDATYMRNFLKCINNDRPTGM